MIPTGSAATVAKQLHRKFIDAFQNLLMQHVMIRKEDIEKLILAGQCKEDEHVLDYLKKRDILNRSGWNEWIESALTLTDEELIHLFKGLIKVEKRLKWEVQLQVLYGFIGLSL